MADFKVEWTGKRPCLCDGEWKVWKNEEDISNKIPEHLRQAPMDTLGTFNRWRFVDTVDWDVEWETYTDGLLTENWYQKNRSWVNTICDNYQEVEELYAAFQASDWRFGSCGGCI